MPASTPAPAAADRFASDIARLSTAIEADLGERASSQASTLAVEVAKLALIVERLERRMEAHDHALNGNGETGIRSDVRSLKRDVESIHKFGWLLVTAVVGVLVLVAVNVMITYGSTERPSVSSER